MGNKTELAVILKTKPEIVYDRLTAIGVQIEARIKDLNISSLVATDESKKSIKKLRTELKKEFAEYEAQRKVVKEAISDPYLKFEKVYKSSISENFKSADIELKSSIDKLEDRQRTDLKKKLVDYLPIVYEFYDAVESGFINKTRYIIYDHELDNNYQYTITTKKSSWSKGELAQYEYLDGTINSSYDKIKEYYFEEIKRNTLRYLEEGLINATDKAFLKELVSRDLSYYYELMQERWNKKDMSYNLYQIVKAIKPSTNYAKLGLNAIRLVNESGVPEKVKSLIFRYNWALKQRKNMLWSLASTRDIATKIKQLILEDENNKVLIFSESTEQINSLTNHTIHSKTADTPAKSKKLNKERLSQFNEGTSREVGSVKMMQLGLNLKGANYAIFESYNSSSTGGKQSQGRLQRLEKWDLATVILIKVKNTQCEKWFESFTSLFDLTDSEYVTSIDELKEVL